MLLEVTHQEATDPSRSKVSPDHGPHHPRGAIRESLRVVGHKSHSTQGLAVGVDGDQGGWDQRGPV